ncbi:MAG: 16S rRNA (guanine(527)-N(7))-methyltransferase RsmG [Desulfobacterales bacterium]|nr:16S rRNA (guanine(527)-N(7))-methyltransferase RsmG [Desulfobacterales bacterium]
MKIGSPSWKKIIQTGAESLEIDVELQQLDQFVRYAEELIRWNRKINLTAITDAEALAIKHFLDSIAPAALIPPGASLLDIGSGAGFPGIPLKIVRPDLKVTLIDAVRKKVSFQKHVIRTLGLQNIRAHQVRAEQFSSETPFDVVITRALSTLTEFVKLALPLLTEDGVMLSLKGVPAEAQAEVAVLQSDVDRDRLAVALSSYRLSGIAADRTIVAVKRKSAPECSPSLNGQAFIPINIPHKDSRQ